MTSSCRHVTTSLRGAPPLGDPLVVSGAQVAVRQHHTGGFD